MPEGRFSGHRLPPGAATHGAVFGVILLVLLMVLPTAAAGSGGLIKIWTRWAPEIPGHDGTNWLTAMSANGHALYAGTASGHLLRFSGSGARLWSRALGATVTSVSSDGSGGLVAVAAGAHLKVFNAQGVRLWSFTIGGVVSGGTATAVAVSRDGSTVIAGAVGPGGYPTGTLYEFAAATGQLRWQYDWGGDFAVVRSIAVSWNGSWIAVALGNGFAVGGYAEMFDSNGHLLWSHNLPGIVTSVSMAPGGWVVAFGSYGVWYATQGSLVAVYNRLGTQIGSFSEGTRVYSLGLLPGGNEVAVAEGSYLYMVQIDSGTVLWRHWLGTVPLVNPADTNSVVVGDGGNEIAAGNIHGVLHIFSPTGTDLFKISLGTDHPITSLSVSPGAPLIWVGTARSVVLVSGF